MPRKGGKPTPMERLFVEHMAKTQDQTHAAEKAGFAQPWSAASKLMQRPAIQREVARRTQELLFTELLPLAYEAHKKLLTDAAIPAGARGQAVKLAYDRTLGALEAAGIEKEPSEMSYDELQASIDKLRREQDQRADAARDVTPSDEPDSGVFD